MDIAELIITDNGYMEENKINLPNMKDIKVIFTNKIVLC